MHWMINIYQNKIDNVLCYEKFYDSGHNASIAYEIEAYKLGYRHLYLPDICCAGNNTQRGKSCGGFFKLGCVDRY